MTKGDESVTSIVQVGSVTEVRGLTKREYFAGLAMQNLQNVLMRASGAKALETLKKVSGKEFPEEVIAMLAVVQADCLIDELNAPADASRATCPSGQVEP